MRATGEADIVRNEGQASGKAKNRVAIRHDTGAGGRKGEANCCVHIAYVRGVKYCKRQGGFNNRRL